MSILLALALIPPIFLAVKIYNLDTIEKEPAGLLLLLFFLGALITIPAGFLEAFLEDGILIRLLPDPASLPFALISNFCIVALCEEGLKYLVLKRTTWNHPAFDYHFDAIVYSVTTSLGFAALENILYVTGSGISVALLRAVTAIPGHAIFGIFMGYFYGNAKYYDLHGDFRRARRNNRLALLIPLISHGFYDFCASSDSVIMTLIFLAYIIVLNVVAYRSIHRFSREDTHF